MVLKPCSSPDTTNPRAYPRSSLKRVIHLLPGARRLERLLLLGISVPYPAFSLNSLWELNLLDCHFIPYDLRKSHSEKPTGY